MEGTVSCSTVRISNNGWFPESERLLSFVHPWGCKLCSHTSGYCDLNDATDYVWTPSCTRAISLKSHCYSAISLPASSVHSLPSVSLIAESDLYRLFIISRPLSSKDGITGPRATQPSSDVDISRLYPRISQLGDKLCVYFTVNVLDVSAVFRNLSPGILG
jgi:hypothetical protein